MTGIVIGLGIVAIIGIIAFAVGCWAYRDAMRCKDIKYKKLEDENKKILYQKKSSEVRLGKIGENLAPFTEHWPYDPNNFRFLGSPIDGIQFTDDMIYLVEIKTGRSRLSKMQKHCKKLVDEGKVEFVSFRVGANKAGIE